MDKIEIILADGGSSDNTIEIAKSFGCTIIHNPFVRAEPGAVLAHKKSKADLKIFTLSSEIFSFLNMCHFYFIF